mmetsp:Transcript_38606/g.101847  ORF Transcript_38606/g.101847 Transcript_38606/m.101847 type:complete len:313 (+) Transcript_38606:145-1083(+)
MIDILHAAAFLIFAYDHARLPVAVWYVLSFRCDLRACPTLVLIPCTQTLQHVQQTDCVLVLRTRFKRAGTVGDAVPSGEGELLDAHLLLLCGLREGPPEVLPRIVLVLGLPRFSVQSEAAPDALPKLAAEAVEVRHRVWPPRVSLSKLREHILEAKVLSIAWLPHLAFQTKVQPEEVVDALSHRRSLVAEHEAALVRAQIQMGRPGLHPRPVDVLRLEILRHPTDSDPMVPRRVLEREDAHDLAVRCPQQMCGGVPREIIRPLAELKRAVVCQLRFAQHERLREWQVQGAVCEQRRQVGTCQSDRDSRHARQ